MIFASIIHLGKIKKAKTMQMVGGYSIIKCYIHALFWGHCIPQYFGMLMGYPEYHSVELLELIALKEVHEFKLFAH